MQAVKELLEAKSVDYSFRVYRLPMPADVPATILSAGTSLLSGSVDVVVPLHAAQAPGALLAPWKHAGLGLAAGSCRALMATRQDLRHAVSLWRPPAGAAKS